MQTGAMDTTTPITCWCGDVGYVEEWRTTRPTTRPDIVHAGSILHPERRVVHELTHDEALVVLAQFK